MNSLDIKSKTASKLWYFFYTISLLILLITSYIDSVSYSFIIVIIRSALSSLIIVLMINSNKVQITYINFIGLGYVLSNIVDIIGIIALKDNILIGKITTVTSIIETISFLFSIKYLSNKEKKGVLLVYIVGACISTCILLLLNIGYLSHNNSIYIQDIISSINMLIVVYSIIECRKYMNNSKKEEFELKNINRILMLKILYFICIFVLSRLEREYKVLYVFTDTISILQMYLVYKITIQTSLINPYIKIIEANTKIDKQSKLYENTNLILQKMSKLQFDIKEKLIYKEEFFNSILSSTPNGWAIFDEDGKIDHFNKAFKNIINNEDDIEKSIDKYILNHEEFRRNILKVCKEKRELINEIETIDNKIYKCTYSPHKYDKGCVCVLVNISNEKAILNNIMELKEEYEDLIVNIKSPVFISDESNNILKFSKSYEMIFDRNILYIDEKKQLNMDKFLKYAIYPDDVEICEYVKKINMKAKSNDELYNNGFFRYRIVNAQGDIVWLESNTTLYYEGDKKYTIISYSDITEYINTKNYLEKTQNMYKALLDSIPEGIYLEDPETNRYIFINKKFRDIFSVNKEIDQLGICRQDLMRIHPDYEEVTNIGISRIKQNKVFDYVNIKYIDMNDKIVEANVASIPFKLENKTLKLTIINDMEDIKYLENLRRKIIERKKHDHMKMEFFINMSHELKTPLNLIFTSTQLLENLYNKGKIGGSRENIEKHIRLTKQNSYRLLKIINDLIDFTKMESGFYKVRMENKDIVLIVEDIVMSVVGYADSKGVEVIFDTNIEELIMGVDVNAIERILLNMLSNAIKFTNSGGSIYVNLFYRNDKIDITVKDTGIGIPKDKIDFIFDRFNDINKGFIGNVYGSGIGLSMVKSIANLIKADINVESELGEGTTFTISLNINNSDVVYEDNKDIHENLSNNVERLIVDMSDIYK